MNWLLVLFAGFAKGIHDRNNDALMAQGIRPNWRRRHVVLWTVITTLVGMAITIPLLVLVLPNVLLSVALFDEHHGNTGLIDITVLGSPIWIWGILAYLRAERRWGDRAPGRTVRPAITARPRRSLRTNVHQFLLGSAVGLGLVGAVFIILVFAVL